MPETIPAYVYVVRYDEADIVFTLRPNDRWDIVKNRFGLCVEGLADEELRQIVLSNWRTHGRTIRVMREKQPLTLTRTGEPS